MFLFSTGIENSYPTLPTGERVDQMRQSGHIDRWAEDFALARALGVRALRWGPAYYLAHPAPGRFDWDVCDAPLRSLERSGLVVIADLCHFGVPDWLGGFQDPAFPIHLAEYARAFARRYPWVRHYTPVNEIFVAANFSARFGWWNECERSDGAYVRALRNLCMAHELAVEAILSETPDAIIVQAESMERFTPAGRDAVPLADEWNALRFVPLDLTLGHPLAPRMAGFLADHGVSTNDLAFFRERRGVGRRWIGLDYYATCEHRVYSSGRLAVDRRPVGFAAIAREYWERYRLPLFHCETHHGSDRAVPWLHAQWREVLSLMRAGVPVTGFTWFSLTDQFDWHLALRELRNEVYAVGLADLDRRPRPVGDAYRELIAAWATRIDRGDIADEAQRATA